jgi:hypothetical protein
MIIAGLYFTLGLFFWGYAITQDLQIKDILNKQQVSRFNVCFFLHIMSMFYFVINVR